MSDAAHSACAQPPPRRALLPLLLAAATVLFIGLTLRIPTISLAPLVPVMKADTRHGETFLSLLTSIPLVLTLAAAPAAPALANRFGRTRTVGTALLAVIAGMVVRSIPGDVTLLIGTAVLGFSIAICTVLVPSIITAERTEFRPRLTGTYSMSLSLGPALALGATIPIREATGFGWRGTLLTWAACSAIALLLWAVYTRSAPVDPTPEQTADDGETQSKSVLTDPAVWLLAIYLGVTSLTFYTTSAWLPTVFVRDGMSESAAGGFAALISIVVIPFGLIAPIVLRRGLSRVLAPASPILAIAGLIILIISGSDAAVLITVLLGIAQGLCLGASYDQVVSYGRSPAHTASVSAVTSAVGVASAALGPLAFGFGLETVGSPVAPITGLAIIVAAQAVIGLRTSRY
jgi:CP family cyanate transporter-like MFS transporter